MPNGKPRSQDASLLQNVSSVQHWFETPNCAVHMVSEQQTSTRQSGAAKNAASNASISSSVSNASIVSTSRTNSFVVGVALVAATVSPASSVKDKVMAVLGLTVGVTSCVAGVEM